MNLNNRYSTNCFLFPQSLIQNRVLGLYFIFLLGGIFLLPLQASAKTASSQKSDDLKELLATLKNPFIPRLPASEKTPAVQGTPKIILPNPPEFNSPPEKLPLPRPNFTISGLVWNSTRPQAIVNGQVVGVGDAVGDWVISKISKNGIEVSLENTTFLIEP